MQPRILEHDAIKLLSKKSVRKFFGVGDVPRTTSPFRYPGGKDKLSTFLAIFLVYNKLTNVRFIEPFCGGAGASLSLLLGGYVKEIHINDKNYALFCFWDQLLTNTEELLKKIFDINPTIDAWHTQKEIYKSSIEGMRTYSPLEYGLSVFFLNRTNRSGILGAGPIGGLKQTGNYKIDCRFNKKTIINKLEKIVEHKNNIHVYNEDCNIFLDRFKNDSLFDDFIYLDPPYVKEGKNIYSKNFSFENEDHKRLKNYIVEHNKNWLISYDDHPLVHDLYSRHNTRAVELSYVMNQAKIGKELMVADSRLRMPESLFTSLESLIEVDTDKKYKRKENKKTA